MLQSKSFVKKTSSSCTPLQESPNANPKPGVSNVGRELKSACCGAAICKTCDSSFARLRSDASPILIIDTDVVLHQIALLENPAIDNVIVLSEVLEDVSSRNMEIYYRIKSLCTNATKNFFVFCNEHRRDAYVEGKVEESPNDRTDRAIRVAAHWYQSHLAGTIQVLLITNNRDSTKKAIEEGLSSETVESYVRSLQQPNLLDLVAIPTSLAILKGELNDLKLSKREVIYPEHKSASDITSGLLHGFYHKGRLRVNRYSLPFVGYVGSESIGDEIVICDTVNMNRAFNGDIVAVELLPQCQRTEEKSLIVENVNGNVDEATRNANIAKACAGSTPTVSSRSFGRVIGIIKRNWSFYCGSLKPSSLSIENDGTPHAFFIPKDRRIPMICIQGGHLEKLLNKRIIVAVDSWDCSSRYPCGHYVRTIGEIGEREVENEIILIENDINSRAFSVQALACLPPHPWSLSSEGLANPHREDLRYLRVFSVDRPGCKDIDDALHCSHLPNGNFEVGVHIADVTNFVHPGTPLDEEAAQRGTSVYLVDKRIDMLPKLLIEDICSLRPGVERFSFSVILTMTSDAKIISTRYTKSTIKSCAALSYVEAQARMDDSRMIDPLTTDLRNLNSLAKLMRQRRIERGALTFDSTEVKFLMDTETNDPLDIGIYPIRETDHMIEEFMLACNFSVAEKILKHFPSCSLLRHQPAPTKEMLEPLHRMAAAVGLDLDISSSKALMDSLDHVVGVDPDCKKLIKILATRCMTKAVYSWSGDMNPTEFHHYGLAAPLYTHFTSPMRRYTDIIVHRLLAAALEISKLPEIFLDSLRLTEMENNLNYRQINAKMANRASIYLYKVIYFKKRPMDTEARIIKIKPYGFIVFVPRFDIEGLICLTSRGSRGEEWILDEAHQRLSKKGTDISYSALQMVIVKPMLVHKVDKEDFYKSIVDTLHHIPVTMQKKGVSTTCSIRECNVHIEEKLAEEQSFIGHSMPSKEFQQLSFDTQEFRNNHLRFENTKLYLEEKLDASSNLILNFIHVEK
ncbi:hypothetical protein IEQ34_000399 [Dendrobium chrysotoxum]|uniref:Exosome complex exonuclease RRP44 n=1 Tax=Dendrobium chrysotoxum TaxID=161865 RepID=A0AAV7HPR9_DENCH|nr:hypothetical protein IEQ34_000399 [Dendrobium chrysotoxum]